MATRAELAEEFRSTFGHQTRQQKPGEQLVSIDPLLAKLKEMRIPLKRIGYMSKGHTGGKFLKLHLTNDPCEEKQGRVLYFDADQKLAKGE